MPWITRASLQSAEDNHSVKKVQNQSVPGEILVRFRKESRLETVTTKARQSELTFFAAGKQISLRLERLQPLADDAEIVEGLRLARVSPEDTGIAIEALRTRSDVIYAEPNYIRRKEAVPNDPLYSQLWGLKNTGASGGSAGADINAEAAWDITTGTRNVVVAVIDEGIDINHQDLQPNIWTNPGEIDGNGVDDDANGYIDDIHGYDFFHNDASVYDGPGTAPDGFPIDAHGTHVAGTIGALGNNGLGVVGVNWQVSLMSLKFLGPVDGSSADLLKALAYAKNMRDKWVTSGGTQGANVRVTNNSYGGGSFSQAEVDAIQALANSGILFVASAGNESTDNNRLPSYPASYDVSSVISVAATERHDHLAVFTNRGSRSVHLAAPGDTILSTTPGNTYSSFSGTSMAAPHVAGTAALVLAAHPNFSVARLRAAILFGGDPVESTALTTITRNRLDAAGALQNAVEDDVTAPAAIGNLLIANQSGRSVSLAWTATGDDGASGRAELYEIRFVDQSGARFLIGAQRPNPAGTPEFAEVAIPYRHTNGVISLVTYDNAGNSTISNVNISAPADAADPYVVNEGGPAALSTGGNRLFLNFDDNISNVSLPFNFPFFEGFSSSVLVSTNGTIYLNPSAGAFDAPNQARRLSGFQMIAGLWDDLDLRTSRRADADVYVVQPDSNRIIFRWQGVPCNANLVTGQCTGGGPVNFEVELQRTGTIITRYGDGNTQLHPVVGIGGAELDSYPIASHTSEETATNLTNAPAVTFTLKALPKKADLKITTRTYPTTVVSGDILTYTSTIANNGPDSAAGVNVVDNIPSGVQYLSCATSKGSCVGPESGNSRAVTAALGTLDSGATATLTVSMRVTLYQSLYENVSDVTARTYDPDSNPNSNRAFGYAGGYLPNPNPLAGATAIAGNSNHYLAITSEGSVLAWGDNTYGQLGDDTTQDRTIPVYVKATNGVKAISLGSAFSMAVKANGNLWTWGYNEDGQLGDGTVTNRRTPVKVSGLTGIVAAAGGFRHSMALKSDGTVWVWGNNSLGQLGDNTTVNQLTPHLVPGLSNIVAIAAGADHCVALRNDGTVWTWGSNSEGQLGDGSTQERRQPTQVGGLTDVTRIAAENFNTGALKSDGTMWTWGRNNLGQLGDGQTYERRTVPGQVVGLSSVSAIAIGYGHMMALKTDGTVWAWGANYFNQLGVGMDLSPTNILATPAKVVVISNVTAIAAGSGTSAALTSNGYVYEWGDPRRSYPYGVDAATARPQLDSISFSPDGGAFTSVQNITISLPNDTSPLSAVALSGSHSLGVTTNGKVYAWGLNDSGQVGLPPPFSSSTYSSVPVVVNGIDSAKAVAAGDGHSLALKTDGTVWGWGSNQYGQIATGNGPGSTNVPAPVVGLSNIVAIAASGIHSAALRGDGTVWTFGYNQNGALGDGTNISRSTPVQVTGLSDVKAIAAGGEHCIAVKNDGTVWTWGYNRIGQLGDGSVTTRLTPVKVNTLANVNAVAAGGVHSAALKNDGSVWGWGDNQYGEIGDGTNTFKLAPTQTTGLSGATALAAGGETTAAITSDGSLWTWGQNNHGQLGTGFPPFSRLTPAQVPGLSNLSTLALGYTHIAAMRSNGNIWMWGSNQYGQVGDQGTSDRYAPVSIDFFSSGPAIHYTTNGLEPTDDDPVINSGSSVMIDRNTILKARAFRNGFAPSPLKSANYLVTLNQIDGARNFVKQHYLDFLNRNPDSGGWDYWSAKITQCGFDAACVHRERIGVSAAFFIELEFQQTGYVVYRFYRAAYGTRVNAPTRANVTFQQFIADRAQLVGGAGLPQNTINLANNFVTRPEFKAVYPDDGSMTNAQFVNKLFDTAGLIPYATERQRQIDAMTDNGKTRAQVLLDVIEINEFKTREYNPAFVLMQYFGYLRRNPDQGGYDFWLNVLNSQPDNFRGMVCSFLTSTEYQQRFGTAVTRSNQDCSQ